MPTFHPRQMQRLVELDRRIVEIASWLAPSRLLNPTLESRRKALEKFRIALRSGRIQSPVFSYLPLPAEQIKASYDALDQLEFGDTRIDDLLRQQAQQLTLQLELLEARGTEKFGQIAARIYGLPDENLIHSAKRILRGEYLVDEFPEQLPSKRSEKLDAWAIAADMKAALGNMDINDWNVVVLDEMSARMSVSARHREVRVKSDSIFTYEDRDRLIVHELQTHVRRACNGFRSGLLNLGLGLPNYMATEEGVASYMEQKNGLLRRSQIETYAYRALGAWLAHHYSFAEAFRRLLGFGASPGLAWDVTLRVKRGLEDTSMAGAFPKDYVYLHGREIVWNYLQNEGCEEDLFLAKISLEQIPLVKEILEDWNFIPNPPQP